MKLAPPTTLAPAVFALVAPALGAQQTCVQAAVDTTFVPVSVSDDGYVEFGVELPSRRPAIRDAAGTRLLPPVNPSVNTNWVSQLSADGTLAVGSSQGRPAPWRGPLFDTMELLLPQGGSFAAIGLGYAFDVTSDRTVILGQVDYTNAWEEADRWVGGVMEPLTTGLMSTATAVTPDGRTVVGTRNRN